MKKLLLFIFLFVLTSLAGFAQTASTGQITGMVKDPNQAVLANTQVILTNTQNKVKVTAITNGQGIYAFQALQPGAYVVEINAKGFKPSVNPELKVAAGQTVSSDFSLVLAGNVETVEVSAGSVENAYRVDNVKPGSPLGTVPILDLPYSVNVISRQLIDDTQSRNFKEAAKYLPLISFQEMQGPEVLRPESRGLQGTNMQNDRKDGMGFAVTTPSALEEYEQIEVVNGLGGPMYGPTQPSGVFNFVTKRPTDEQYRQIELGYEGDAVGTVHADLGGRVGPNHMFGYRTNLVIADGTGYVNDSQLRRQLAAVALDVRPFEHTVIEGNFSYYNLFQHGYPGWFSYNPTITPTKSSPYTILPVNAPDPTREGYGQPFAGVNLNNQIGEVRVKQDFTRNWHLVVGAMNQIASRDIDTPVNSFVNKNAAGTAAGYLANPGNYQSFLANSFSALAPRFQVGSNLAYVTGKFKTWKFNHDVVFGSTGYRFASWSPVSSPAKTALCPEGLSTTACASFSTNISSPVVDADPGVWSYTKTNATNGIYVSSVIHQQGFNFGDTITLSPRWLLRGAVSQDWTWTNNYLDSSATKYALVTPGPGNTATPDYSTQGVSSTGSIIFKPRTNMSIYGTFADSLQAPDSPQLSTSTTVIVNSAKALAPYRDIEGEVGYKLTLRRINFSTAFFRVERPFANVLPDATPGACGTLAKGATCNIYEIEGNQLNYGVESMLSGKIFSSLMVTGGLTVLNPKLTDTPSTLTNNRDFIGIPSYKSNILAEYRLPVLVGAFFNFDWQHVGRRPIDDINSTYTPQYNTFDLGVRYTTKVFNRVATWRVTANNISDVHYWSTLGPGNITGMGTSADLGHLGEPRLITASMRYDF
jgi:iron complex outermembrane receptor protein